MDVLPPQLARVKDFVTYKVYNANEQGKWEADVDASGPDLAEMIGVWQFQKKAKIIKAEAPAVTFSREAPARFRVAISTFVYYTPAVEGSHDPAGEQKTA